MGIALRRPTLKDSGRPLQSLRAIDLVWHGRAPLRYARRSSPRACRRPPRARGQRDDAWDPRTSWYRARSEGSKTTMSASKPGSSRPLRRNRALAAGSDVSLRTASSSEITASSRTYRPRIRAPGGIGAGVRFRSAEQPVGDDVGQGVTQNGADVRFIQPEGDHADGQLLLRQQVAGRIPGSIPRCAAIWKRLLPSHQRLASLFTDQRRRCSLQGTRCRRSSPNPCARRCRA